jgi:hypothetical protein
MAAMRRAVRVLLLLSLALPATSLAAPERDRDRDRGGPIAEARRQHGATQPAERVAGGAITVEPTEGLAGLQHSVKVTLAGGESAVDLGYPARFQARALNGRSFVPGRPSGRALGPSDRTAEIDVSGLPAGTYRLPVRRGGKVLGTAVFRLYARRREGDEGKELRGPFGPVGRNPVDSSQDATEESETFVVAVPGDASRFATYGNDIDGTGLGGLNVTTDGGGTWAHPSFPVTFDLKTPGTTDIELPSGDPILAADANGNIWAGGLSVCQTGSKSHIFVNRIAAGATDFGLKPNVAIPFLHGGGTCNTKNEVIQDKPQMTIGANGRLYVTWDDPDTGGGTNEVVSYCDTQPTVTACDSADNWTNPAVISDAPGSYITSDVAVGPDGKVYVAWWDYSNTNAVAIDMCDPAVTGHCSAASDWGTDQIVASLSFHNGQPVPFACPTLAQPGGRAAPVPSLAVDRSGGAGNGRIYVGWSDLSTKGAVRCSDFDQPRADQDTFKSYVASAPNFATLTANPATQSQERGTNIIGDAGDHWFPWVAVDQSTGQAYVDLYSTRDDATRRTAKFYARAVVPGDGSTRVSYGPLTAVSDDATNYSDTSPCCQFDNDYGDYTGLDAAGGNMYAVWTHRLLGGDGDVYVNVLPAAASPTEVPSDDALGTSPPPPPPPPPTTTGTTPTPPPTTGTTNTTPTTPLLDRKAPRLKVTFAKRADRRGRYTIRLAAAGEAAAGRATLRLAKGSRRSLGSRLIATSGSRSLKLVIRLKRKDLRLLKRRHKLRVTLTVSLTDVAGNRASGRKTFTLRLKRR